MKPTRISVFRGGGYVTSERNQFQKDSRIHLDSPRCRINTKSLVHNGKEVPLA
jgi:hypothetical protein